MQLSKPFKNHHQLITDQMGYQVEIPLQPTRIISLVPSQTELLFYLGLAKKVVGVTKFCIHPQAEVKGKAVIGGTKNFNLEDIAHLQPDLIIGNKEENYPEGIAALQQHYPVWMSDINSLADALDMIAKITAITNTKEKGSELIHTIKTGFDNFLVTNNIRTAYFIWRKPYMAVGSDTFIHEIMRRASFRNVFAPLSRYSVITPEMLQAANPQLILLSSEPYPFREKHLAEIKQWCPEAIIKLVDGEMFSWYGSRLQYTPAYLRNLQQKVLSEIRN